MRLIDVCPASPCDTCPIPPIGKTLCRAHKEALDSLQVLLANGDPLARAVLEIEILACYSLTIHHAVAFGLASYNGHVLPLLDDMSKVTATLRRKMAPDTIESLKENLATHFAASGQREAPAKKDPVH